jgi:hypothetical protein
MTAAPLLPFDAPFSQIQSDPEPFIRAVFESLQSDFLTMPKGEGFLEFSDFEQAYEALKQATLGFRALNPESILPTVLRAPVALIVLRSILGMSPPEWAYLASQHSGLDIQQGFARTLDRNIRLNPTKPLALTAASRDRVAALVSAACALIATGPAPHEVARLHRLAKADTQDGLTSLQRAATIGLPYAMTLYERYLGRPFASHRDSVSEMVGDTLEVAIEEELTKARISFRKTKRAEKIPGFDQAPDFVIPSEFNPRVVIEAKVTEDDGTARDKVTRIQHLSQIALEGTDPDHPKFELIACIGGRGFAVRREDMRKLLFATRGKLFTLATIPRMIESSALKHFRSA